MTTPSVPSAQPMKPAAYVEILERRDRERASLVAAGDHAAEVAARLLPRRESFPGHYSGTCPTLVTLDAGDCTCQPEGPVLEWEARLIASLESSLVQMLSVLVTRSGVIA